MCPFFNGLISEIGVNVAEIMSLEKIIELIYSSSVVRGKSILHLD